MKKIFALLLVAIMSFSLVACGGDKVTNTDNEIADSETTVNEKSETTEESPVIITLDIEGLTGTWVWQEEISSGSPRVRSFELYADGTGKILATTDEALQSVIIEWSVENGWLKWSSASKVPNVDFNAFQFTPYDNYLTDMPGSNFYAKEEK